MNIDYFRKALLSTSFLVAMPFAASPAFAQAEPVMGNDAAAQQAAEDEPAREIVVTGSRLTRPNMEANSPIAVVTGEQLVANADVTLETFLNTLPQANPAGTTTSNNPGNFGQANIDLRGLGANRNIVLVDGRRPMVSAANMTVDLNTIPAALIERIDVITGGAGATYGADAISGVVNLVLKSNFQGIDLRATYANTAETDAREFNASAVIGGNFADGRGNAVFGFDYTNRQGLIKSQRPFAALATSTTNFLPEGFYLIGANAPTQAAVDAVFAKYGVGAGKVSATTNNISFNTDGTLFGVGVFRNTTLDVQNFRYPVDLSVNTNFFPDFYSYNFDEKIVLVLPLERRSFMGKVNFEVSPLFQPFAQVGYTRYTSTSANAPTPFPTVTTENTAGTDPQRTKSALVEPGQAVTAELVIPVTNPFIPADFRTILASRLATNNDPALVGSGATEPFRLRFRTLGAGARTSTFTNEVIQFLGGVRGDLSDSWRYEAYFSEGRTEILNQGEGAIDSQRVQALIESPTGTNSSCPEGFNPFGRNPLSAACANHLIVKTRSSTEFKQKVAQAFVAGDLVQLPAGAVGAVLGVEQRRFKYSNDPGALSGPISGPNVVTPAAGQNSFKDIFAELRVPIAEGSPFLQSLELSLGWRMSKFESRNNINGVKGKSSTDHTYKVELSYAPIDILRLRGSYQRAVRAPNFAELFNGAGAAVAYFDPCSASTEFRGGKLGASAQQALDLCINATAGPGVGGTPAGFASFSQTPGSQLSINLVGNPQVNPEKADTFTLGAVMNAPASTGPLSTLRASLDYYRIKVRDAIVNVDANSIIADCFNYLGTNPNFDPSRPTCEALVRSGQTLSSIRNPSGPAFPTAAPFGVSNQGLIDTSGIDVQVSYGLPFEWLGASNEGRLSFDLYLSHLLNYKLRDLAVLPLVDYSGTVGYFGQGFSGGGGASFPKWRGSLSTTYSSGPFSLNLRTRYIHKMVNRSSVQYSGETIFTGVPSVWYFDTAATWNIENMTFRLGINNLTDKKPPIYSPNVQSGTDPSLYDVIGRRFFVSIGLRY